MSSNNRFRSILSEISNFVPEKNKCDMLEMRAHHILSSVMYLFDTIDENCSDEEAEQLKRRFMSSIKNRDPERFIRYIRKIKEDDHA